MQKQRQDAIAGGFLGDMYNAAALHPAQHPPCEEKLFSERDERVRELLLCAAAGDVDGMSDLLARGVDASARVPTHGDVLDAVRDALDVSSRRRRKPDDRSSDQDDSSGAAAAGSLAALAALRGSANALSVACACGELEAVERLLALGKSLAVEGRTAATDSGASPFWLACAAGHAELVTYLADEASVNKETPDDVDATPLLAACAAGQTAVLRLLLARGVDHLASDMRGNTPFHFACRGGHLPMVQMLLAQRAPPRKAPSGTTGAIAVDAPTVDGHTPLCAACWHGRTEVVALLLQHVSDGAAGRGGEREEGRKASAAIEVDVNACMRGGATPLFAAAYEGHLAIVDLLLGAGADVGATTEVGSTVLFASASRGHVDVTQALLRAAKAAPGRLDADLVGRGGLTALGMADLAGHAAVVAMLRQHGCTLKGELEVPAMTDGEEGKE